MFSPPANDYKSQHESTYQIQRQSLQTQTKFELIIMIKSLLLSTTLLTLVFSMKLTVLLNGLEKHCFYEILQVNQKYSVDTIPKSPNKYQIEINHMLDGQWQTAYFKATETSYQSLNVHKLASASSTYSICFKNAERQQMKLSVDIQSGLELLQFELLPDKNDSQNLDRELNWLQNQKRNMFSILERMESLRASTEGLTELMSVKMIGFAVIGLFSIIVVNFMFYKELKKTFKERKLI